MNNNLACVIYLHYVTFFIVSERDLIPALVTFLSCLFVGVELGIIVGVAVDIAILIYFNARPHMDVEYRNVSNLQIISTHATITSNNTYWERNCTLSNELYNPAVWPSLCIRPTQRSTLLSSDWLREGSFDQEFRSDRVEPEAA